MPIKTLRGQERELGRIRLGRKQEMQGGKTYPVKLETFRLTAYDKAILEKAASLYGGKVVPWEGGDGQWDLVTETNKLPVIVQPDALSQWFEHWTGSGCDRRCDGETELISGKPCLCQRWKDAKLDKKPPDWCKPTSRLKVRLHQIPDLGVWSRRATTPPTSSTPRST
jgi:hypothetical protein